MSGGKGGGSTTSVEIPEYIERAAQRNLNRAEDISQLGYVPQYGPDVAAFTPSQQSAFQNTADSASAFGMAAPTSQQDIMGGMDAPTEYANGVSGYSSQPIFQQSLDQLQAERPGQFNHTNSFFIDPFTGQPGSRVRPAANYGNLTPSQNGMPGQANSVKSDLNRSDPNEAAMDQALDASMRAARDGGATRSGDLGDGLRGNASSYTSFSDRFDGGGKGVKGGAFQGGGVLSAGANAVTNSNGDPDGDPGTVICTSMHALGLISDDVYKLDAEFGERINKADPSLLAGYQLWATPVADYILGSSFGSKLALSIITPLATSWAAQMAHVMRPEEYKPNLLGKIVMFVGHPICRIVGHVSSGDNLIKGGA